MLVAFAAAVSTVDRSTWLRFGAIQAAASVATPARCGAEEKKSIVVRRFDDALSPNGFFEPDFGLVSPDIYYPASYLGEWSATSRTESVDAPLGTALFGGTTALDAARREVESEVRYDVRFVVDPRNDGIVADRPYNAKSLATATMGKSVLQLDSTSSNPNRLDFTIETDSAVFVASLRALSRLYDQDNARVFRTSELFRQTINVRDKPLVPPSVKDVETLCIYTLVDEDHVVCRQRTATWLYPSDQRSALAADAARGASIDVRTFSVDYRRSLKR